MGESAEDALRGLSLPTAAMILCTCVSASALNIQGMFAIKQLGASSMQIIGNLNIIVLVACSMALFGETFPKEVVFGTALVLTGVAIFEYGEALARNRQSTPASPDAKRDGYELVSTKIGNEA